MLRGIHTLVHSFYFSAFIIYPCAQVPEDETKPWYVKQNVGINKLRDVVAEMSVKAKLPIHYTNHSLRTTAITTM